MNTYVKSTLILLLTLGLLTGCDLVLEEEDEGSSSGSSSSVSNTETDVEVNLGPVFHASVRTEDGSECSFSGSPGTYTCSGSGDISVYPKIDTDLGSNYYIGYCEEATDNNCTSDPNVLEYTTSSTAVLSAPSGSRKVDTITSAIKDLIDADSSLNTATAITLLNQMANGEIPTDYLESANTQTPNNDVSIAQVNFAITGVADLYISESLGTASAKYTELKSEVSSATTVLQVEQNVTQKHENNDSTFQAQHGSPTAFIPDANITVDSSGTGFTLSTSSVSISESGSAVVIVTDSTGTLAASSSSTSTATVIVNNAAKTLTITGVAAGSATITVTDGSSTSKTISVTVTSSGSGTTTYSTSNFTQIADTAYDSSISSETPPSVPSSGLPSFSGTLSNGSFSLTITAPSTGAISTVFYKTAAPTSGDGTLNSNLVSISAGGSGTTTFTNTFGSGDNLYLKINFSSGEIVYYSLTF